MGNLYTMYALERVGMLANMAKVAGIDWYRVGSARLVGTQRVDGSWHTTYGPVIDTGLALLFLGKGRAPIVITKQRITRSKVARVGEVDELVKLASVEFGSRYTWQSATFRTPLKDVLLAPLVFINGYAEWNPTDAEVERLRDILTNGAILFVNACNAKFDKSFRAQLPRILPGARLIGLPAEHPIYSAHVKIVDRDAMFLEGVSWQCRMPVIYSPRDLSYGWAAGKDLHGVTADVARAHGLNVIRYVIGKGKQLDRLRDVDPVQGDAKVARKRRDAVPPGAFIPALLRHGGDFDPDPDVFGQVLDDLRNQLPIRTGHNAKPIRLTDKNLFNYPFLMIKGHRKFTLSPDETKRLVRYVKAGGFVYLEACCGAPEFDQTARALLEKLWPDAPLAPLPADHALFTMTGKPIDQCTFSAITARQPGRPPVEGIEVDGRTSVMYLPMSAGCAINGHPMTGSKGLARREDCLEFYRRVVQYAMTR